MTLRETQSHFARLVPRLIDKAYELGFDVTIGEVYRSPEEAERLAKLGKGIKNSLHTVKLAIDLNLFRDGKYLSSTESHHALGEWWESQCGTWGGRFTDAQGVPKPDGNHYSWAYGGRK
jgi:hypothetical protein